MDREFYTISVYVDENENKVDETVAAKEPKFKLENLEVTAVGIHAELQIKDDDGKDVFCHPPIGRKFIVPFGLIA